MKELHLLCNAHLDPVWLWNWEEGAGEAVATFRVAADLCEQFPVLIFNHNESLLYRWVEEYEPALFACIQRLVEAGRWHIMGGWYLQPDCNLPSGEAMVRQVLHGRRYFAEKFGARPRTAINFDSFGHSRGLVQILTQAGFDSYIHTRPSATEFAYPAEEYRWTGFDGSALKVHHEIAYSTRKGKAVEKIAAWLDDHAPGTRGLLLWGIGNHGGGPSREDLERIARFMQERGEDRIVHSTPERFFDSVDRAALPETATSLRPCFTGCYTSQARIKQRYRALENELLLAEKMASHAALAALMAYPKQALREACEDMLFAQFHDILAGSSIQPAEEASLRQLEHGLEILSRVKARAFFALAAGERAAGEGEIPLLVYNPHPFALQRTIDMEFTLEDVYLDGEYFEPVLFQDGVEIPSQCEREACNLPIEFRKRVVFLAALKPAQMNRIDCRLIPRNGPPAPPATIQNELITVATPHATLSIGVHTGLVEAYEVDGTSCLAPGSFMPVVLNDVDDPWGLEIHRFEEEGESFQIMSPEQVQAATCLPEPLRDAVRIIEDGPVRTVVEALFQYGASVICQRYLISKHSAEFGVETRVYWSEQHKMLKLQALTTLPEGDLFGQTLYGTEQLPSDGAENVAHRWIAVLDHATDRALTVINDGTYGLDFNRGRLRLSLLRSSGYAAMPFQGRRAMPADRFSPRIDQGERVFRFWVNAGPRPARMERVHGESQAHNETPMALAYFPPGSWPVAGINATIDKHAIQLTAFKQAEDRDDCFILRLFEATGTPQSATLRLHGFNLARDLRFNAFEIKSLQLDTLTGALRECTLLEE
ncbi:MAG: alpha-mannosidase [Candidatus Hydrogenedentes bacterium]|nr:alpha-mannosidase [Candidatus Hydrogenedentota bacterium]